MFPAAAPAETAAPQEIVKKVELPETLTVSGLSYTLGLTGEGMAFGFVSNVSMDGTVVLYSTDGYGPYRFEAKYANGAYTTESIPQGRYTKAVFVVRDGDWERSALLATDIAIEFDGASWTNVD